MIDHYCEQCHQTFPHRTSRARFCSYLCFTFHARKKGYWPATFAGGVRADYETANKWARAIRKRKEE